MLVLLQFVGSFLIGPIGRYVLMTVVGLGFMAWIRADAAGPYKTKVAELTESIQHQQANAERDRQLAVTNATKAEELQSELDRIIDPKGGTRLRADELDKLRKLAARH